MKKYFLAQLSQVSAWIGFFFILSAFFASRPTILVFGGLLILTDDEALKGWVSRKAPWLVSKIEEWTQ
ncbi:hypothetical protein ACYOEI_01165 [Singulisphaera rosea]